MNGEVVKRIPLGARVDSALANIVKNEATKQGVSISRVVENALRKFTQEVSSEGR
jgi:predicted HicB family RNase H-like nuclease